MSRTTTDSAPSIAPKPSRGWARSLRKLRFSAGRRVPWLRDRPITIPYDRDLKVVVRYTDRAGRAVYLDGYPDRTLAAVLDAYLRPGMTYFDVGSHMGLFALMAAKRIGPTGRVHAFEATPDTFERLRTNIRVNRLEWVRTTHAAVFDRPGEQEMQLCVPGKSEFNSLRRPRRPDHEIAGTCTVPAITLDDYCARHSVDHIDLMKIDTNGAELQVLRGARNILSAPDAPPIICECNDSSFPPLGYTTRDLRDEFESLGYGLYTLDEATWKLVPEPPSKAYPETVDVIGIKDPHAFEAMLGGRS